MKNESRNLRVCNIGLIECIWDLLLIFNQMKSFQWLIKNLIKKIREIEKQYQSQKAFKKHQKMVKKIMCGEVDVSHLTKALSSYSKVFIKVCDEKKWKKLVQPGKILCKTSLIIIGVIVFKITIRGVWRTFFHFRLLQQLYSQRVSTSTFSFKMKL